MRAVDVVYVGHSSSGDATSNLRSRDHYAVALLAASQRHTLGYSPLLQLTTRKREDPRGTGRASIRPFEFRSGWTDANGASYPKTIWRPHAWLLANSADLSSPLGESSEDWTAHARRAVSEIFAPTQSTKNHITTHYGVVSAHAHPIVRSLASGSVVEYDGHPALILSDGFVHREHRLGFAVAAPLLPCSGKAVPSGAIRFGSGPMAGWRVAFECVQTIEPRADAKLRQISEDRSVLAATRTAVLEQLIDDPSIIPAGYLEYASDELAAVGATPHLAREALAGVPRTSPPHIDISRRAPASRRSASVHGTVLAGDDAFPLPCAHLGIHLEMERHENSVEVFGESRAQHLEAAWFEPDDVSQPEPDPTLNADERGYFRVDCGRIVGGSVRGTLVVSLRDAFVAGLALHVNWQTV